MIEDEYNDFISVLGEGTEADVKAEVQIVRIPVNAIINNPHQPRKEFDSDSLAELAGSIGQYGVLQPLLVSPSLGKGYILIAGERRMRAAKIAEIALIENLQRQDLDFLEEAEGYQHLISEFGLTQESVAGKIGKKQSTVANKLRLLKLSQPIRSLLRTNHLTERHARALLKLDKEEAQLLILNEVIAGELNVRQSEKLIEKYLADVNTGSAKRPKRLLLIHDVRIYLNSIKQIAKTMSDSGLPVEMEQTLEGNDLIVRMRIPNAKR